jgi:hypothetical protein
MKMIDVKLLEKVNGLELLARITLDEAVPNQMKENSLKIVKNVVDTYREYKKETAAFIDGMGQSLSYKNKLAILASMQIYNNLSDDHVFLKEFPKQEARKAFNYCNNTEIF